MRVFLGGMRENIEPSRDNALEITGYVVGLGCMQRHPLCLLNCLRIWVLSRSVLFGCLEESHPTCRRTGCCLDHQLGNTAQAASFFELLAVSTHEAFDSVFTMDASDSDFDIKLQKISGDLIADLDRALTTSLRKPDGHGGTQVRSFVRAREIFKSTTMVVFSRVHL